MLTHTIELYDQEAIWGKYNTLTTSILIGTLTVEAGVLMTLIIHSLPLFVRFLVILFNLWAGSCIRFFPFDGTATLLYL